MSHSANRNPPALAVGRFKLPKEFGGPYRLSVTDLSGNNYLVDVASDLLTEEQFIILKDAAFHIKQVFMTINAKENRGNIFDARMLSIEWPQEH